MLPSTENFRRRKEGRPPSRAIFSWRLHPWFTAAIRVCTRIPVSTFPRSSEPHECLSVPTLRTKVEKRLSLGEQKSTRECRCLKYLVPEVGLEPTRCFHRRILSPLRLPIPPFRHSCIYIDFVAQGQPSVLRRHPRRGKKSTAAAAPSLPFYIEQASLNAKWI